MKDARPNALHWVLIRGRRILKRQMLDSGPPKRAETVAAVTDGRWMDDGGRTCDIVSKAHRGQGDHHKIGRLQQGPLLHLLEHQDGHRNEEQAAQQDGQEGRDHPHDGRTHPPFLPGTRGVNKGKHRRGFSATSDGRWFPCALTRKRVSILATSFLSTVPRWSPTPASRMPNKGIPTSA